VWLLPFVTVFGFVCGVLFASMGMIATAVVPSIDFFNYPIFLFITPMFLFSGTFFPLTTLPKVVQTISYAILPLTHVVASTAASFSDILTLRCSAVSRGFSWSERRPSLPPSR